MTTALIRGSKHRLTWPIVLAAVVLLVSGCWSKSQDTTPSVSAPVLASVQVTPQSVYLWPVDNSTKLAAVGTSSAGAAITNAPAATWSSKNPAVATVDSTGRVTAVSKGSTVVVATVAGISTDVVVVVAPSVEVSGVVRYQDKAYTAAGFDLANSTYKAVRFAKVDVLDSLGGIVATTQTDSSGAYRFAAVGAVDGQRVRVLAETGDASGFAVHVSDDSAAVYAVSKSITVSGATITQDIDVGYQAAPGGAFNIYDVALTGAQFAHALSGVSPPNLKLFWETGVASGTQYCTGPDAVYCPHGEGIYVSDDRQSGDTDEYDDDVIWHEFGHFLVDKYSRDDSEGGCHFLTNNDLDMRLAWSEGWGDFFAVAVKRWLKADPQRTELLSSLSSGNFYLDTARNVASITMDLDQISSNYSYATNEVSIAKLLWDISNEFQMEPVWTVLTQNFKTLPTSTPINLEAFFDGWRLVRQPNSVELGTVRGFLRSRQVYYEQDAFEAVSDGVPNLARRLTLGVDELHYLYRDDGSTDVDIVAFDAIAGKTYTVETSGLRNGADTDIRILTPQQAPLVINGVAVENDDAVEGAYESYDMSCDAYRVHNTPTALASKTSFVAPVSGTYYVDMSTTRHPPPLAFAGRYGTYAVRVTEK